jgi:hypothetical protein
MLVLTMLEAWYGGCNPALLRLMLLRLLAGAPLHTRAR